MPERRAGEGPCLDGDPQEKKTFSGVISDRRIGLKFDNIDSMMTISDQGQYFSCSLSLDIQLYINTSPSSSLVV